MAAALLLDCVAHVNDLGLRRRLMRNVVIPESTLERGSAISSAANYALVGGVVFCAVTFLAWFYLAYQNLESRGGAKLPAHWSITGWAVPVVNLWRPPSIMRELTSELRSSDAGDNSHALQGPGSSLVWPWWLLLGLGVSAQAVLRVISVLLSRRDTTNEGWLYWQIAALLGVIVLLGAAVCAFVLVGRVERQQRWFSNNPVA